MSILKMKCLVKKSIMEKEDLIKTYRLPELKIKVIGCFIVIAVIVLGILGVLSLIVAS